MKIYNYDLENGFYIGESIADESPLETGVYLIPAHATEIEPPKAGKGKIAVWLNDGWELQDLPKTIEVDLAAKQAEAESRATARQAILDRLGLTAEEAAILLG
jgi:hypothetical protein